VGPDPEAGLAELVLPRVTASDSSVTVPASELRDLARLDWRFLLPLAAGGRLGTLLILGPSGPGCDRELFAGIAHRVAPGEATEADLVAIPRSADVGVAEAVRWLAPDGFLYYEVASTGGPRTARALLRKVRRDLRRADLRCHRAWGIWPSFEDPRAYVPLDAPRAVQWFLTRVYPARLLRERVAELLLRASPLPPARLAYLLTSSFAFLAGRRGTREEPLALSTGEQLPAEVRGVGSSSLLLGHGRERVSLLPFATGVDAPQSVLKIARLPVWNGRIEQEQRLVGEIRSQLGRELEQSLPEPRGVHVWHQRALGVERCAPGVSLVRRNTRWGTPRRRKVADLELAVEWLTRFHRESALGHCRWGSEQSEDWVEAPLSEYRQAFGATRAEDELFAAVRRRSDRLRGAPLPIVWRHRDFTPWNLLRAGDLLSVIDWEGCRPGPPLCDLLHFLTHWNELAHRAFHAEARRQAFVESFLRRPPGRGARGTERAIEAYMGALGIDGRFSALFLVVTWVEVTARWIRTAVAAEADTAQRERTGDHLYVEALAEHRGPLFGQEG
jgi:aminoglycoside phosphotransferase (APT) family kinase protein